MLRTQVWRRPDPHRRRGQHRGPRQAALQRLPQLRVVGVARCHQYIRRRLRVSCRPFVAPERRVTAVRAGEFHHGTESLERPTLLVYIRTHLPRVIHPWSCSKHCSALGPSRGRPKGLYRKQSRRTERKAVMRNTCTAAGWRRRHSHVPGWRRGIIVAPR